MGTGGWKARVLWCLKAGGGAGGRGRWEGPVGGAGGRGRWEGPVGGAGGRGRWEGWEGLDGWVRGGGVSLM